MRDLGNSKVMILLFDTIDRPLVTFKKASTILPSFTVAAIHQVGNSVLYNYYLKTTSSLLKRSDFLTRN